MGKEKGLKQGKSKIGLRWLTPLLTLVLLVVVAAEYRFNTNRFEKVRLGREVSGTGAMWAEMIQNAAELHDYRLAQRLWEEGRQYLGTQEQKKLYQLAYPREGLQRVIERWQEYGQKQPMAMPVVVSEAMAKWQLGQKAEARELLSLWLETDPNSPEVLGMMTELEQER